MSCARNVTLQAPSPLSAVLPARTAKSHARPTTRCCSLPFKSSRSMPLPGGLWLLSSEQDRSLPVYGPDFVITRPPIVGVDSSANTGLVPVMRKKSDSAIAEMCLIHPNDACVGLVPVSSPFIDVTEHHLLAQSGAMPRVQLVPSSTPGTGLSVATSTAMSNLVMQAVTSSNGDAAVQQAQSSGLVFETNNTSSPRRTSKVKFSCNRCGAVNIKPVNPHAYASGSVFAKCGSCNITHKLIDNLKLFHELSGPVFNVAPNFSKLPEDFPWPNGLPSNPEY